MTLLMGKLDLPWSVGEHDLQIRDCNDRRVIDQKDDWDESDFVDLYPEQAALIVRAVNAHDMLMKFVREVRYGTDDPALLAQASEILAYLE